MLHPTFFKQAFVSRVKGRKKFIASGKLLPPVVASRAFVWLLLAVFALTLLIIPLPSALTADHARSTPTKTGIAVPYTAGPLYQPRATGAADKQQPDCPTCPSEPPALARFREAVGGSVVPVIVELRDTPGALLKVAAREQGREMATEEVADYAMQLREQQSDFLASLASRGVRALLRETDVEQPDGSVRHIEYRFHYLANGFVAYLAADDIERLRAQPEVLAVHEPEPVRFMLDKAIDYSLGTQTIIADRRTAVYGPTLEWSPAGALGHPEAPEAARIDGFEGQGMIVAVIDSGIDWRHPMFGGTGSTTPMPRVSGNAPSATDNQKVIYYYALSSPGNITDDFGHGTLVSSCVAGYKVDGNTPPIPGYGTGRDGTGIGPTPNNATLHGTAPQARLMAYKVCGPSNSCVGDIELAMEDAVSPVTLGGTSSNPTPTAVSKPVADVINLSLGDTAGDPTSFSSKVANNAALAGTIVVSSAGNAGPGASTLGAPSVATLAISVAASLDPGSITIADVLAPNQIPGETRTPGVAGPPPETGAASDANTQQPGEPGGIKLFTAAGGGALPTGSLSAHYVYVNETTSPPASVAITNRIALVKGTGAFANIANQLAPLSPAAILIITTVESATALVVVGGIPTYTINPNDANHLLDIIDGVHDHTNTPNNTISVDPLRLSETTPLGNFQGSMASFSSRGPEGNVHARFRQIKPDVTGPGVGILGAATPTGLQEATLGLSNPTGYVQANGTSFSGPITAGAMALIRQRVRLELGLDTTDLNDMHFRSKRFDAVTVSRALLMNSATNLRSGLGVPQGDGAASVASINDMGAGHINLADALAAHAIMVAPTFLIKDVDPSSSGDQGEFTAPTSDPPPASDFDAAGNLKVMIPSISFGPVPVSGVNATVVRAHQVIIRDVTNGAGAGTYNLTSQDNRNTNNPGVQVSFLAADGITPTTSVTVPSGGQASYFVRVGVNGNVITADPTELQWYVTATHNTSGQKMRMPFYYRAVKPVIDLITAPTQNQVANTEQPPNMGCPVDTNSSYTVNWSYAKPADGPNPVGFRVQEGTHSTDVFFDNADTALVAGANAKWTGSNQWVSAVNPDTGSQAYFIADAAMQNESLTMANSVVLPAGGATLSFVTSQDLEPNFDFGNVEVTSDGVNFINVAKYTGMFHGTRTIDISQFAGQSIKVRFRFTSDLANDPPPPVGWFVDDIRVSSDDFHTIGETNAATTSLAVAGRSNGAYLYRVAALFSTPNGTAPGPYSNTQCVTEVVDCATAVGGLSAAGECFAYAASSGVVGVTISGGCSWGAVSNATWIHINTVGGPGNGTVSYTVDANTAGGRRSGTLTIARNTFTVLQGAFFPDVAESNSFFLEIGKISARGITVGCGSGYCPSDPVTREQMAAFLNRAAGEFAPPTPATQRFADVPPESPFYAFIDRLAARGITFGCGLDSQGRPIFCPSSPVTREQMAAFLIRAFGCP